MARPQALRGLASGWAPGWPDHGCSAAVFRPQAVTYDKAPILVHVRPSCQAHDARLRCY